MGRVLLLVLAAAFAAASPYFNGESIYRPGVEYTYDYESQVLTGIRSASEQVSGLKVHCKCRIQLREEGETILKLENIRVSQVNHDIRSTEAYEILPEELTTLLTGEATELLTAQLRKPIKFRFEDGEVRDISITHSDPYWSVNIKKGILSLMQLNLKQKNSINERESSWSRPSSVFRESSEFSKPKPKIFESLFKPSFDRRIQSSKFDSVYKVMESDVTGDCETKYAVRSDRSTEYSSVSEMIVTKVKNFENCVSTQSYVGGILSGMPHYPSEKNLIHKSVEADYVLTGDRHHFLIKKAKLEGRYVFKPTGQESGHISSHIIQKLTLLDTEEIRNPIELESALSDRTELKMHIPKSALVPEKHSEEQRGSEEWQYKELVEKKLDEIIRLIYPKMQDKAALEVMFLNLLMRHVPPKQLTTIIKTYIRESDSEHHSKKREILLDTLPTLPSPDTVKVISELIRDGSIRGVRAILTVNTMSLSIKPTPEVVKILMQLYRETSSLERETPHLRQTVLLAVGTVCNKMLNRMKRENKPHSEIISTIESVASELERMLEESRDEEEKVRILKSLGNMGAKEIIPVLKTVLENTREPTLIRVQAIYALRKLVKSTDKQLHPLLLSTFLDTKEDHKIRIAAFVLLRNGHPSKSTLQLIAHSLTREPSMQIKTLVYTNLVNIATHKTNIFELQQTSKYAREVLKTMRSIPVGPMDSKTTLLHLFSEKLEMGGGISLRTIKSKTSGLPESIVSTLHTSIFGDYLHIAEGGFEEKGLETIIRRLFGPHGLIRRSSISFNDVFSPLSRPEMGPMSEHIRDIFSKVVTEPRFEEELKGLLYVELFGQELQYRVFDSSSIERITRKVWEVLPSLLEKLSEGVRVNVLKTFSSVANTLMVPTPIGVPLSLNMSSALVFKVDGHIKVNNMPTLYDIRRWSTDKITVETDLKPSICSEVVGYMGVDMRWIKASAGVKAVIKLDTPIKGEISIHPRESKLTIKYETPKETTEVIYAKVTPLTMLMYVPSSPERLPYTYSFKEIKEDKMVKKITHEKFIKSETFGVDIIAKMQRTKCLTSWCAMRPLSGKHEISIIMKPTSMSRQEVFIKVKKVSGHHLITGEPYQWTFEPREDETERYRSERPRNYRTESREMEFEEGFEPVQPEIPESRKTQLFIDVGVSGSRPEHTITSKVTWLTCSRFLKNQLNVQIMTVPNEMLPEFKVMMNTVFTRPTSIYALKHFSGPEGIVAKADLKWGWRSFSERHVKCKLTRIDQSMWNEVLHQDGIESSEMSYIPHTAYLYKLDTEWSHMGRTSLKYINKVCNLIKYAWYKNSRVTMPETPMQNKITVLTEFIPKYNKMSFVISTPLETTYVLGAPFTTKLTSPFWKPELHDRPFSSYFKNEMDDEDFDFHTPRYTPRVSGECKIKEDKVTTFDGITTWLPISESFSPRSRCEMVLAQDCSDRRLFSVVGTNTRDSWKLKVVVPKYYIEVITSKLSNNVIVKINGEEEERVRRSQTIHLREIPEDTSSPILYTIEKIEDATIVKCHELGMKIVVDETKKIVIKMSPLSMLQGQICGICGDYSQDKSDEFFSNKRNTFSTFSEYTSNHAITSGTCERPEFEREYSIKREESCKKEVTMKIRREIRGVEEVCFSKSPIYTCKESCTTVRRTTRPVHFTCLPAEDTRTAELIEKVHRRMVLDEVSSLPTSLEEIVHVAEKCTSVY